MTPEAWSLYLAATALSVAALCSCIPFSRKNPSVRTKGQRLFGFVVAIATAGLVLSPPLDELSDRFFSAHMVEHELLLFTMPIALLASMPLPAALVAPWRLLPSAWRRGFGRVLRLCKDSFPMLSRFGQPFVALALSTLTLWLWHVPFLYDLALKNDWIHLAEHLLFFVTALVYWRLLLNGTRATALGSNAKRAVYLMLGAMQGGFLGALIALHSHVIYSGYLDQPGKDVQAVLVDQQIGGAVMWFSGAIFCSVMAAIVLE